jgi:thiamine-monophosphate kinase
MPDTPQTTTIDQLGEFGLIDRLTRRFRLTHPGSEKGIGDDAAVILPTAGQRTLVSTDLLVEGVHFDLMYTPLMHLGYKAIIVNLSDIYAMNAIPRQVTVSIAVSSKFTVEAMDEIYEGIYHACTQYGVDLIGGDTTSSLKGLVISVTAIGEADEDKIVYRNGAKEGDLICVTGDLGAAYLGLQLLEREKRLFLENPEIQPELDDQKYLVGRQLKPEARREIIEYFNEMNLKPTAMMDLSDGLSSDMLHICRQSGVGCEIHEGRVPIAEDAYDQAIRFNMDPITCALNGGEDYELLFTIHTEDETKVLDHPFISVIGQVTAKEDGCILLSNGGYRHNLTAQGWKHF